MLRLAQSGGLALSCSVDLLADIGTDCLDNSLRNLIVSEISAARFLTSAAEEAPSSAACLTIILLPESYGHDPGRESYGHAPGEMKRRRRRILSLRPKATRKCPPK